MAQSRKQYRYTGGYPHEALILLNEVDRARRELAAAHRDLVEQPH